MDTTTAIQNLTSKIDELSNDVRQINTYIQNDPMTGRMGIPSRLDKIEQVQDLHSKEIGDFQEAKNFMIETKKSNLIRNGALALGSGGSVLGLKELGEFLLKYLGT